MIQLAVREKKEAMESSHMLPGIGRACRIAAVLAARSVSVILDLDQYELKARATKSSTHSIEALIRCIAVVQRNQRVLWC